MKKGEVAEILRKAFLQINEYGKIDNQVGKKLFEAISGAVQISYTTLESDIQKDLVNETFLQIHNSMSSKTGNGVWLENKESNSDSDNILIKYYYSIIRTAFYEIQPIDLQRETINLDSAIRNILKNFISEKYLIKNSRNEFCRKEGITSIQHLEIKGYFFSIQNNNGTINYKKLETLIKSFFDNELEKFAISVFNLVRLITEISDYGNAGYFSISEGTIDDDEENKNEILLSDTDKFNNPEFFAEVKSIAEQWFLRVESVFEPEELVFYAKLYFYKFGLSLTLEQISEKLGNKLGKSSVDNYVKRFIRAMKISNEADIDNLELGAYLDFFMRLLIEKLNLTESDGGNSDEYVP